MQITVKHPPVRAAAGLYQAKPWFLRRLRVVEDYLVARRVTPDALTGAGVVVSVVAGVAFALGATTGRPLVWLVVPVAGLVRLALNALDGAVARRTGTARRSGMVVNEVGDVVSDAAFIGGTAFVVAPALTMAALAAAQTAALAGVLSVLAAGRRDASGPMGKADRIAVLSITATAGAVSGSVAPIAAGLWVIAGGAVVTAVLRLRRLRGREAGRAR